MISTFEKKVIILLNLLDIYDNKIILKNEITKFLVFMNYQSFSEEYSIENIIEALFRDNEEKNCIEFSNLYENIIYNPLLSSVFKYLLQDNNQTEKENESENEKEEL